MPQWKPNFCYDDAKRDLWPPEGHPLAEAFFSAREGGPGSDARAAYEKLAKYVGSMQNPYDGPDVVQRVFAMKAGPIKLAGYRVRDWTQDGAPFGPVQIHLTHGDTVEAVLGSESAKLVARFVRDHIGEDASDDLGEARDGIGGTLRHFVEILKKNSLWDDDREGERAHAFEQLDALLARAKMPEIGQDARHDRLSLTVARKLLGYLKRQWPGGDAQLQANIQVAVTDALREDRAYDVQRIVEGIQSEGTLLVVRGGVTMRLESAQELHSGDHFLLHGAWQKVIGQFRSGPALIPECTLATDPIVINPARRGVAGE